MVVVVLLLVLAALATCALLAAAMQMPTSPDRPEAPGPARGHVRLLSRLLFARRSFDAITLDCTLVAVDGDLPAGLDPPQGLPFTLHLRCPETTWFATRVEELLAEWAEENRELVVELSPDRGRVRTTVACGPSSVHLELAGAAGLGSAGLTPA